MEQFKQALKVLTVKRLKEEASKYNKSLGIITGYSKMSKDQLIEEMSKHKDKFMHLMTPPKQAPKKPAPKKMQSVVPKSESKKEIPEKAMTEDYQYEYIDKLDVGSINYKSIKQNIKIEMSLSKNNKHIRLRWFTAFWKPNKPRAQKGLARKVLCEILLDLVKKKKITKDYTFDLMAANINVKGMNYDPKKQEQMYHSLGFKTTAYARIMKQTVGEFVEKCERDILND